MVDWLMGAGMGATLNCVPVVRVGKGSSGCETTLELGRLIISLTVVT